MRINNYKVIGVVLVKNLIGIRKGSKVVNHSKPAVTVNEDTTLDDVLDIFRKVRQHLLIVVDEHENVLGIITLEDVLEEVFGYEMISLLK